MFINKAATLPFLILILLSFNQYAYATERLHPWGEMALMDLQKIKETLKAHHVGPVDPENPNYKEWLITGFAQSVKMAQIASNYNDYIAVVSHYTDGFNDGHITLYTYLDSSEVSWPGFILKNVASKAVVSELSKNKTSKLKVGDQLISCDDKSLSQLMIERVYPYQGISGLEAETVRLTPEVLISKANKYVKAPDVCIFLRNNLEFEQKLAWSHINYEKIKNKYHLNNSLLPFSLTQIEEGIYRVSLPTFNVHNRQEEIETLIAELQTNSKELRQAKAIIFDVIGNNGGSSGWAVKVVNTIFGNNIVERAHKTKFEGIDWRISVENIESQKYWLNYWQQQEGESGSNAQGYKMLTSDMGQSLANGDKFLNIKSNHFNENKRIHVDEIKPKIYFLTDTSCFSACLGMADIVMSFPDSTHIGMPTRADAIYIDNRSIKLPSGNADFSFSMKVYRGRTRGHNQPYIPSVRYLSEDWSQSATNAWFLQEVWPTNSDK